MLDINAPQRADLLSGPATQVDFHRVDVSDAAALHAAFLAPWPDAAVRAQGGLTVLHAASTIRFYERHAGLLARSERVNVLGTQNVVLAAQAAGADVLVYTSSGSTPVRKTRFLLWPWQAEPEHFVQLIGDDDGPRGKEESWSNYASSKGVAEKLVCEADESSSGNGVMRTGCIRPSNGTLFSACMLHFVTPKLA